MSRRIAPAPVRKTITVKAPQNRAFDVFTAGMGRWWRKDHHLLTQSPLKDVVIEPRTGGRWYEQNEDGSECDWGKVLAWEPPARLVLAWQLNAEWKYDPDLVTEVEVQFIAEGPLTRVVFEHRNLERFGARAEEVRAILDSMDGWGSTVAGYAAEVHRRPEKRKRRGEPRRFVLGSFDASSA